MSADQKWATLSAFIICGMCTLFFLYLSHKQYKRLRKGSRHPKSRRIKLILFGLLFALFLYATLALFVNGINAALESDRLRLYKQKLNEKYERFEKNRRIPPPAVIRLSG